MKIGTAVPTEYYEKVAQMGYDYIEIAGVEVFSMSEDDFNSFVERVKKTGLPVKGYNAYCGKNVPIVGEDYTKEKAEDYARIMCKRGLALGIETIGIGAPMARMLPEGYDMDLADAQATEFVQATAKVAKEYGFTVLFEAVHNHMCDYCNLTSHGKKIIDMVDMDNVKLILDFYHVEVMNEDLDKALKTEGIVHLHINKLLENYGRGYITNKDGEYLKKISEAVKQSGYKYDTITIEAEAQYFESFGTEGLKMMREYF